MSDNAPHSIAFWLTIETHERKPNGQLSGSPKDSKSYTGGIHCKNRVEAKELIEKIIFNLKEDLKKCQTQTQIQQLL
jgi:hypothetical protein